MTYEVTEARIWVGGVEGHVGALTEKLERLQAAGVDLESALVRPSEPMAATRVLFVGPILGAEQEDAARESGLRPSDSIHALRVTGPDHPGLLAQVSRLLADAGVSIHGMTAASPGGRCAMYIRLECRTDAERAAEILRTNLV